MIVVGASAILEVLLNTRMGRRLADRLFAAGETLHASHLIDVEVAQVLRRYSRTGELDDARGRAALDELADLRSHAIRTACSCPGSGSSATT